MLHITGSVSNYLKVHGEDADLISGGSWFQWLIVSGKNDCLHESVLQKGLNWHSLYLNVFHNAIHCGRER